MNFAVDLSGRQNVCIKVKGLESLVEKSQEIVVLLLFQFTTNASLDREALLLADVRLQNQKHELNAHYWVYPELLKTDLARRKSKSNNPKSFEVLNIILQNLLMERLVGNILDKANCFRQVISNNLEGNLRLPPLFSRFWLLWVSIENSEPELWKISEKLKLFLAQKCQPGKTSVTQGLTL